MPVEVVLGDVQDRCHGGLEIRDPVELEAGQFEHPHVRQRKGLIAGLGIQLFGQGVEQRRADIAGHCHGFPCTLDELAGQRGHGGFAVGAGDADELGRIGLVLFQAGQRLREQAQFVAAGNALRACRRHHAADRSGRQTRAFQQHVEMFTVQQCAIHGGMDEPGVRHAAVQGGELRRRRPCIGHGDTGTAAGAPARQRQAGSAQPQNQNVLIRQVFHLSFSVESPTRHSSMVMIQKRTTTWVSFQPHFSKWWCSGAICSSRRPWP